MTDMTKRDALIELRDKVQAGDDILTYGGTGQFKALGFAQMSRASSAYHGSLDSAKALHEAVLPGWWWKIGTCTVSDDACVSPEGIESIMPDGREWAEITDIDQRPTGNPARAWLLSILEALIAMEDHTNG